MNDKKSCSKEYTKAIITGIVAGIIIFFGIQSTFLMQSSGYSVISVVVSLGLGIGLSVLTAILLWPIYWRVCKK